MNEHLLLLLPHRQMVFTFPKVLRAFFRHDRRLYGEISKMVYRMIQRFYNAAVGRRVQSAAVISKGFPKLVRVEPPFRKQSGRVSFITRRRSASASESGLIER